MYSGTNLPGAYQGLGFASVSDAIYGTGTGLELIMTYGMRGAFTHNWNAYWNTALYGAYGAVRYNAAAKALICGSPGIAALGLTGTCNPDLSIGQLGLIIRWIPVKNLTLSADFNWPARLVTRPRCARFSIGISFHR